MFKVERRSKGKGLSLKCPVELNTVWQNDKAICAKMSMPMVCSFLQVKGKLKNLAKAFVTCKALISCPVCCKYQYFQHMSI